MAEPMLAKTETQGRAGLPQMPGWMREREAGGPQRPAGGGGEILPEGGFLVRDLEAGEQAEIRVLAGHLWVTVEGDARDYVLVAGNRRSFSGPGRLVVEALEAPAEIFIADPVMRPAWQPHLPLRQP